MTVKTDGLLAQHHLLLAIIHTEWATRLDHKVAAVIIERYFGRFGNSRASLRYLADRTGATRPNIIASVRRLTDHGAFTVIREGAGTRPTEYALNFDFCLSGIADDTSTSGIADNTSCGIADDTSTASSGTAHDTKTYLHVPAYKAGLHEGRRFEAAPTAPPPPTAGAVDEAVPASGDGADFTSFWSVWPRKHGKAKAESEWKRVDAELRNRVITAAATWAEHYVLHGVDKKWIPEPANWLKGERWDEDLPIIHIDAKGAAITKAKANAKPAPAASNDNVPIDGDGTVPDVEWLGEISPFVPPGQHKVKVTSASNGTASGNDRFDLVLDIETGGVVITGVEHTYYPQDGTWAEHEIGDVAELVGREAKMDVSEAGAVTYRPLTWSAVPGLATRIAAARASGA